MSWKLIPCCHYLVCMPHLITPEKFSKLPPYPFRKHVTEMLLTWTIRDLQLLRIVIDQSLKDLTVFLVPQYLLPSWTHIKMILQKRRKAGIRQLSSIIGRECIVGSLTTDGWSSKAFEAVEDAELKRLGFWAPHYC